MKRIGHIYEQICSIENLNAALDKASQGKRRRNFVAKILNDRDYYIEKLHEELLNGTYQLSPNKIKVIKETPNGKERTITIPKFYPDQIIHWAVCLVIQPKIMKGMYHYNCGSVPKRGGLYGKKAVDKIIKNDSKVKYVMQLDIEKFYPSVSNDKMKEILAQKIKDKKALKLIDDIIDNGGRGLPLGYYTSQWFSNLYLEQLDHYIKEILRIRHYIRYVDDMILFDTNKRKLHKSRIQISEFLDTNKFNLKIKGNWQLWKIHSRPLNFLGYKFYKSKTLLRNHIFLRIRRKVARIAQKGYCTIKSALSITSLLGWLKRIPSGKNYYLKNIKPVIPKCELSAIISIYDKRRLQTA